MRLRTFTCSYAVCDPDDSLQPVGPTIGDQVTEFFDNEDAWPVSQSLTIQASEWRGTTEYVTHVFTLAWIPRMAYMKMQAEIMARAQQMITASLAAFDKEPDDGNYTAPRHSEGS